MRKKFITTLMMCLFAFNSYAGNISYIKRDGNYYHLNDSYKKTYKIVCVRGTRLVDYSSSLFIVEDGSYLYIYDDNGNRLNVLDKRKTGNCKKVFESSFTTEKDGYIRKYNYRGTQYKIVGKK